MSINLFSSFSILQIWLPVRRLTKIAGSLTNAPRCLVKLKQKSNQIQNIDSDFTTSYLPFDLDLNWLEEFEVLR